MHSYIGPEQETLEIYIAQSHFKDLDTQITIYDVGLGAASNAIAAMAATARLGKKLTLISFETDLTGIELALKTHCQHENSFPYLKGSVPAIESLLKKRRWESERVCWQLLEGSFFDHLQPCPPPDLIYYDFYSPKTNPELWSIKGFTALRQKCAGHKTKLLTYAAATKVRAAMLLAGFYVGHGPSTAGKKDTTQAATLINHLAEPLGERWFSRLQASHDPLPTDWKLSKEHLIQRIGSLEQFKI
jgi:tRNA U34 5-methylaminomethyl-2-thiouridine-forming methyltransferase MnmC